MSSEDYYAVSDCPTCGKRVIYEDESIIEVPVVLMKEGVFTGSDGIPRLKKYDEFAPSAHWLLGVPITRGHINQDVRPDSPRIGQVVNVYARPKKRDVFGTSRFFINKLTIEELERIRTGKSLDGSIGYRCPVKNETGTHDNKLYDQAEYGDYVFYHYAIVTEGACSSADGCGVNQNQKGDILTEEKKDENASAVEATATTDAQKADSSAATETEPVAATTTNDKVEITTSATSEAANVIIPDTSAAPAETKIDDTKMIDLLMTKVAETIDAKLAPLNEKFEQFQLSLNSTKEDVVKLNSVEEKRLADEAVAKEQAEIDSFKVLLNAKAQENADVLFKDFKSTGATWFAKNTDKLMNSVPDGEAKGDPHMQNSAPSTEKEMQDALSSVGKGRGYKHV